MHVIFLFIFSPSSGWGPFNCLDIERELVAEMVGDLLSNDFISELMGPKTMSVSDQKVESSQVKSDLTAFSSVLSLMSACLCYKAQWVNYPGPVRFLTV